MCGFVGFLDQTCIPAPEAEVRLTAMCAPLIHRGPDGGGIWQDTEAGIGFGHRRLAIVDLSPAGHQPMLSASGRFVIIFNGEIYNHQSLRADLEKTRLAPAWRGHSDTESFLAGFDAWGIEETLRRANGMFAIAVWDNRERRLTLARDRLGEKPLYYGWQGQGQQACFLFGSEIKGLRPHPAFKGEIDRDALCLFMRHNCIGGSYSIYRGLNKLEPGFMLSVSRESPNPLLKAYWSGSEVARAGVANPFKGSPEEAVDALEILLKDAVKAQMMSDVPLGAFLSGGIDSSTIVALMQAQSSRPVKTFSIGFHETLYDEAVYARDVAKHLGTDHTELYVTPQEARDVIPRLPLLYDEPFADSSQIPTFLVAELARRHVVVSLSGDAGDELFCGYTRYQLTSQMWKTISCVPRPLRRIMARGLTSVSLSGWNKIAGAVRGVLPFTAKWANVGDKIHKGAGVLASSSVEALYYGMVSHWPNPEGLVIGGKEPSTLLTGKKPMLSGLNDVQRMMALDMLTYLPDDILVKVDRAAMGVSLESRVPFLDPRVIEFAWRLPMEYKLRNGETKWALRQVLYRHVPKNLIERPKMGFGVPIDMWLRGALKDWAEDLLDETKLRQEGFFRPEAIRVKWAEHLSGARNWQYHLWDVLMFQAWLRENGR